MRLAAIKNGVVDNVIAVDPSTLAGTTTFLEGQGFSCVLTDTAGPGWTYDGTNFYPPTPVVVTDPCEWLIDIGPFFDRFQAKKLPVLMSTDATVIAVLKDVQIRKWIDLQREDVSQSLDLFVSKGLITSGEKIAILTTPVTPYENAALRKSYFS